MDKNYRRDTEATNKGNAATADENEQEKQMQIKQQQPIKEGKEATKERRLVTADKIRNKGNEGRKKDNS